MATTSEVKLILNAVDNASSKIAGVSKSIDAFGQANKSASNFLTGFGVSLEALNSPMLFLGQQLRQSIDQYAAYGKQVGDVSRQLGVGAEEASKLIQVADDLEIEFGTLRQALKTAQQDGIDPSIEGIAALAEEYKTLPDATAKAQFAIDKFGRAGIEMQKILELSGDEIRAMGEEAAALGLVMDEQGVKNAEDYRKALDNLGDTMTGLQNQIGSKLVPVLGDAANAFQMLINWSSAVDRAQAEHQATVLQLSQSYQEYKVAVLQAAVVSGDLSQEVADIYKQSQLTNDQIKLLANDGVAIYTEESYNAIRASDEYTDASDRLAASMKYAQDAAAAENKAIGEQANALDAVSPLMQQFTKELLFNQAAQTMDAEGALMLARSLGLVDEGTALMLQRLPILKEEFDRNKDGIIDASEAAGGYNLALKGLAETIKRLDGQSATAYVNVVTSGTTQYSTGQQATGTGSTQERASGGPVVAGQSYVVGEQGPERFTPMQSGYISNSSTTVIQRGDMEANFYMSQSDPASVARQVAQELARRMA